MPPKKPVLDWVRDTLTLEARTLQAVAAAVDGSYARAVDLLFKCRGKVIVTGIGKSGIVAQKIAATLASTGTPALYLHPTDGLHGDIGIVERDDVVLAIGKSGESPELNAILPSLKALKTRIVCITAVRRSSLARTSDVVVVTPVEKEACPLDLAPTCSTTAALAVGDALAVALMKLRGFKKEQFARLHPGGQLGKRLTLFVRHAMRSKEDNPVVAVDAGFSHVLLEVARKHAGATSVVGPKGRLVGFITDHDIRRAITERRDLMALKARDVMNAAPVSIREDRLAVEAVSLMTDRKKPFNTMPVVDARGRAVGILHIQDLRAQGL